MLRAAVREDLHAVAAIYAHHVEHSVATFDLEAPDVAEWDRRFAAIHAAGLPFLVAEQDGAVAGYAYCVPWKSRPAYRWTVENSIYLAPWAVGHGIGDVLLDGLIAGVAEVGVREVIAVVADSGDPASRALHERRGFTEAGRLRRVGYKHGRWLDTVLLQRSLRGEGD
ncbi:phosphinothricin acetyltransferase [Prauserella shujinwangii]|uniref:Phosphinothricin acetyltransferase n=1 Tax=Prauserella shujinwangii TaxID=1453103 RepID=A0A2T0LUD8_9PSEU|nr:phosphinothricin acetyltransferase [Prauserella shujinwangii]